MPPAGTNHTKNPKRDIFIIGWAMVSIRTPLGDCDESKESHPSQAKVCKNFLSACFACSNRPNMPTIVLGYAREKIKPGFIRISATNLYVWNLVFLTIQTFFHFEPTARIPSKPLSPRFTSQFSKVVMPDHKKWNITKSVSSLKLSEILKTKYAVVFLWTWPRKNI